MVSGPETALAEVEKLERDERLSGYHYLPAIKADLLSRLGLTGEAAESDRHAFDLAAQEAERASSPSRSPITPTAHEDRTAPLPVSGVTAKSS